MTRNLLLKDFAYELPEELIAQNPADRRDASRLLEYKSGKISHYHFKDLPELLPPDSLLVLNDSKVIPGRLHGFTAHGGRIEVMLLSPTSRSFKQNRNCWRAIGRPMKKLQPGATINFPGDCEGLVTKRMDTASGPAMEIEFSIDAARFEGWLDQYGLIPLPPYIHREVARSAPNSQDRERYQTVFARQKGSVAAPTAGLHFTPQILAHLEERGVSICPVTLHVGAGTFLPVKTQDPSQHRMHSENFMIQRESYQKIIAALDQEKPIIVVGTTSFRSLQTFHMLSQQHEIDMLVDRWLETELFIYPKHQDDRYKPWATSGILTNFHQSESTLFMLVCALLGWHETHQLYQTAIKEQYRFFSYGDGSLLWL